MVYDNSMRQSFDNCKNALCASNLFTDCYVAYFKYGVCFQYKFDNCHEVEATQQAEVTVFRKSCSSGSIVLFFLVYCMSTSQQK